MLKPSPAQPRDTLPRGVWVLGFVSLLMDTSSELIHSLLPMFMVTVLGASALQVGWIEGLAEATALIVKVFSGVLSDFLGKRKGLAIFGYGLAALTKPLFALAPTLGVVFAARMLDRVGKGVRGAPRDALVADLTPPEYRGAAFGLRQALDAVGATLGPLLAVGLMLLWADQFQAAFWVAVIPAAASIALLAFGLKEPPQAQTGVKPRTNPIRRENLRRLNRAYWWVAGIGALITLARFSEAFLVLQAQHVGIIIALVPLTLVVMNLAFSLSAYPCGRLADHVSRRALLIIGLAVLAAADLLLATVSTWWAVFLGMALWGLHLGLTQGLLAAMVADAAPGDLRGTAFGFFNLVCGVATLFASVIAGLLWDRIGPAATFGAAAGFCALAIIALMIRRKPRLNAAQG
ncbi:MFS transporter [Castellaniella sp.]|uniref:MFS transporter n=1 Tax=Castellaniella sp. TaxID=1955812 RepID=UPI003C75C43E